MEQVTKAFYAQLQSTKKRPLLEKVKDYFAAINITVGPVGISLTKETANDLARDFSNVLEKLWEKINGDTTYKCLTIVLDETDKLAKSEEFAKDFAYSMRSVIEHLSERNIPNIKFVVSALPETYSKLIAAHQSLARALTVIDLGRFDQNSTCELVKLGLDSAVPSRICDENFIEQLFKQSDGIPYHIQVLCYYAFEFDSDGMLSEGELKLAWKKAIELLDSKVYGPNWNRVKNNRGYKEFLTLLANREMGTATIDEIEEEESDFTREYISTIASALRIGGFVASSEERGVYRLSSTLCQDWIKKYI